MEQTVKAVGEEIGETDRVYKRPEKLRKRKEKSDEMFAQKPIEPNESVFSHLYFDFLLIGLSAGLPPELSYIKRANGIKVGKTSKITIRTSIKCSIGR